MMDFFNTAVQLLKLEKVEIGGIRGKALTSNIYKVYEEFKDLYSVFSNGEHASTYVLYTSTFISYFVLTNDMLL